MTKSRKIKITKGIPAPKSPVGRRGSYPFKEMEVGDSFIVESSVVSAAASAYGKRHDMQFKTQQEPKGTRVWRIA